MMSKDSVSNMGMSVVLCYHRIIQENEINIKYPNDGLSLTVDQFEKQLLLLQRHFVVSDIKDVISNKNNHSKNINVIITFDDGYKGVIDLALPIIEKYHLPITIFLTTGIIADNTEFCWWEDLWQNIICETSKTFCSKEGLPRNYILLSKKQRMKCYNEVSSILISMKRSDQLQFFNQHNLKIYKKEFMSTSDIQYLNSHPLVTLGYHSNYHYNYSVESKVTIEKDIVAMLSYFNESSISPQTKLFAFSHGFNSRSFVLSDYYTCFDHYFYIGFRSLIKNSTCISSSRLIVNQKKSFTRLYLEIILFRAINIIKDILHNKVKQ